MTQTPAAQAHRPFSLGAVLGIAALLFTLLAAAAYAWGPHHFRDPKYWSDFLAGRATVGLFSVLILSAILYARQGGPVYVRRIAGLTAIDETVGRATEMGRPITFSLGLSQQLDIIALQALAICLHVVRLAIRFGTRVIVTMRNATVYAVADEAISEAYAAAGRPESFNRADVRFLSDRQFAYASAAMGTIIREKAASNYMFGEFFAEALILAEAGNLVGAIQVAGTPSTTQVPFFIASCDYTLIGEEFYGATAYLTREPTLCGSLMGQDRCKLLILSCVLIGVLVATAAALTGDPGSAAWVKGFTALFTGAK